MRTSLDPISATRARRLTMRLPMMCATTLALTTLPASSQEPAKSTSTSEPARSNPVESDQTDNDAPRSLAEITPDSSLAARWIEEDRKRSEELVSIAKAFRDARLAEVRLAEGRLDQAKRVFAYVEAQQKRGNFPAEESLRARVSLLGREADVERARADYAMAEARHRRALRRLEDPALPPVEEPVSLLLEDLVRRVRELERRLDHTGVEGRVTVPQPEDSQLTRGRR